MLLVLVLLALTIKSKSSSRNKNRDVMRSGITSPFFKGNLNPLCTCYNSVSQLLNVVMFRSTQKILKPFFSILNLD